MEVLRSVMEQPVPEHTLEVDEDERMELPWWKCKKWAVHTLYRLFERYLLLFINSDLKINR